MSAAEIVDGVCGVLSRTDVQWCFLRDVETLLQDKDFGDDVDIWIARQDIPAGIRALVDAGYLPVSGRLFWDCGKSPGCVLRFRNDRYPEIDFEVWSGGLRAGPFVYLRDESIATGYRVDSGYPVPSKAITQVILTNRLLLAGRLDSHRTAKARMHFGSCDAHVRSRWKEISAGFLDRQCLTAIESALLGRGPFPGRCRVLRGYFLRRPRALVSTARTVVDAVITRLNSVARGSGRSIAFVGTDGAGKSTLASLAGGVLYSWGLPFSIDYMGRSRGQLAVISAIRERVLKSAPPGRSPVQGGLSSRLGAIAYLLDYWIRFIGRIRPRQLAGRWTLIDRGPADLGVMRAGRSFRRLVHVAPRPSASVFCFAEAETVLARKQERSKEEIKWQQTEYRDYFVKTGRRMPVLFLDTTTRSVEHSVRRLSAVLSTERGRGRGVIGSHLCRLVTEALSD